MALNAAALKGLIETELTAQGFHLGNEFCYASKMATAIANAVVAHIVAASELVPITTDSGPAGAGIITGKVR
jgi:hypothetical protein